MKSLPLPALLLIAGAAAAAESPPTPQAPPLRPIAECLRAQQVLEWGVLNRRHLVVKSLGGRYYDVRLTHDCRDLERRPYLAFRSGTGGDRSLAGRVCGDIGDAVIPHSPVRDGLDLPCDIASIRRIDAATYEAAFGQRRGKTVQSSQDKPAPAKGTASL